jgi:hypothetical protein
MEFLLGVAVVLGAIAIAVVVIGALFWVLTVAGVIAVVAWLISEATGLPFWGTFIVVAVVAGVAWAARNLFDG